MRTVARVIIDTEDGIIFHDGFGDMYMGDTAFGLKEGDTCLIETWPSVKVLKKLMADELLYKHLQTMFIEDAEYMGDIIIRLYENEKYLDTL